MLAIRGATSRIAQELIKLLPDGEQHVAIGRHRLPPTQCERYLFAAGLLAPKKLSAQSASEIAEHFQANFTEVHRGCEHVLAHNPNARICVIGSESAFTWSFNDAYAGAKAALHRYIETRALKHATQQLVCVAPSIISDAGMTVRRLDQDRLAARAERHPKGRFLTSAEVARLVHYLLYVDSGYLTNQVIRLNGGEHIK